MKVESMMKRKNHKGKVQIYLRYFIKRQPQYVRTELYVEPWFFDHKTGRVKDEYPNAGHINLALLEKERQLERELLAEKNNTFDNGVKLHTYWLQHIKNNDKEWSFSHKENLKGIARKFERFRPEALISDVDYKYLKDFKAWCFNLKRPNTINTINKNYEQLRAIITEAIKDGLFKRDENPFDKMQLSGTETKKERLKYDQIQKLAEAEPANDKQQLAKLTYLFAFYNGGVRWGDICRLQWSNVSPKDITFTPNKTKKSLAEKSIVISPPVRLILGVVKQYGTKKYVFPMLEEKDPATEKEMKAAIDSAGTMIRTALKDLAKANRLPEITPHTARHAFTDHGIENDVPDIIMMQLLGMKKLSTYLRYKESFNKKRADKAIQTMFGE